LRAAPLAWNWNRIDSLPRLWHHFAEFGWIQRGEVALVSQQTPSSFSLADSLSLPAWFPFLWSRVLFPGVARQRLETCRLRSLLILLIVPAALLYPRLSFRLFEPDESRYAEIPREMLARGEVVVPYLQGEPYLDKPPLLYWLIEGSYTVFGVHDWSARLVPALALHACILATYFLGRRSLGERPAFWGALGLSLAPGFISMGRLLLLDGLLTLWATLALLCAFEAVRGPSLGRVWWLLAAVACGLGVLTKGPVALALLVPPLWLHRRLTNSPRRASWLAWLVFGLVVLAVALPWFVAMSVRVPAFARQFLWEHNVRRFLAPFAHEHGIWFYAPILFAGLLPGAFLGLPFVRFLLSGQEETARQRTPELGFMLLGGGWCVLFFTLSQCKLPTYILPAFPPLALALGYFLVHSRWALSRRPAVVAGLSLLFLGVVHHIVWPWYAEYRSPMYRPAPVVRLCADRSATVVCYPRACDSVAFYLGRDDLRNYRSKDIEDLRGLVRARPRTVILCTHRHSLLGLKQLLPPEMRITEEVHVGLADLPGVPPRLMKPLAALMGETALGLCDLAVVEHGPLPLPQVPLPLPSGSIEQADVPGGDAENGHDD
jgi:4-amino-4-deoxy-L-arabinose transferase-like glycosyltransferase